MVMAVLISGTADSVSGQLPALGRLKALVAVNFSHVKRTGTFFAHTAAR